MNTLEILGNISECLSFSIREIDTQREHLLNSHPADSVEKDLVEFMQGRLKRILTELFLAQDFLCDVYLCNGDYIELAYLLTAKDEDS